MQQKQQRIYVEVKKNVELSNNKNIFGVLKVRIKM